MDMTKSKIATSDLLKNLENAGSFHDCMEKNQNSFIETPLHVLLNKLIAEKGVKKIDLIREAEISEVYGYQIFGGKKRPERDKLLSLTIPMKLTLEETENLLKATGYPLLYAKQPRDAVVIYGILHGMTLLEINELLYKEHFASL